MKPAPALMIQGTGSSAGKSLITAGLLRILRDKGFKAAPFKSQNMALNSFVTEDGGEIGRAQAVQAAAAGVRPTVHMNPILIKPEGHGISQIIIHGRPAARMTPAVYYEKRDRHLQAAAESLSWLRAEYDIVVIEGAGSPAEINLRDREIVNMTIADLADAPVVLVANIELGGVFASILGTLELLEPKHRARVIGCIINNFRGDETLLASGIAEIERRTGVPILGVLPHIPELFIAEEDSMGLTDRRNRRRAGEDEVEIAVILLPKISNFDDFAPLESEPGVVVRFVDHISELSEADLVIVPGSKTTVADLNWLRESGLADALIERAKGGGLTLGICGGCQMLGKEIHDENAVESDIAHSAGLGLLSFSTRFEETKTTAQVEAQLLRDSFLARASDRRYQGYEIHSGTMLLEDESRALFSLERSTTPGRVFGDGTLNEGGTIAGTLLHGLFENAGLRRSLVEELRARKGITGSRAESPGDIQNRELDRLAAAMRRHLDLKPLLISVGAAESKDRL